VIASRGAWRGHALEGGGELELAIGTVTVFEDDRVKRIDQYDPDDRDAILARFGELTGRGTVRGERPPERWLAEFGRRWDAHDPDALLELFAEEWVLTDRRTLALWEQVKGKEAQAAINASVLAISPDTSFELDEVLACDERVIAVRAKWLGSGPVGGGESTVDVGGVWAIESGLAVSGDVYEPEDRQAIIARYIELGGGLAALGDRQPERLLAQYARTYARFGEAPDPFLELHSEDFSMVDHRQLALWEEVRGRDGAGAIAQSAFAACADVRLEPDEVLACDDRVVALRGAFRGQAIDGGGPFELPLGSVVVFEDGMFKRIEQFEAEDREGMLARYRELGGT
jgi:ketosteroid isomerase-like protein